MPLSFPDFQVPTPSPVVPVANPLNQWMLTEGWTIPSPRAFTGRLAEKICEEMIPLCRLRILLRTLHPQFLGTSYLWKHGIEEIELSLPAHEILQEERFTNSPFAPVVQGAGALRRRLDVPGVQLEYPILEEIKREGVTDYVAMPLVFSNGRISPIAFASDRPGGFSSSELSILYDALPVMARLYEIHALRKTAKTILQTYLGRQTGTRVLDGQIRRGDGENIHAVLWYCDLRSSTKLADTLPRPVYLAVLNAFLGAMAGAVHAHQGEVLRFIGDAAVAIFPIKAVTDCPEGCPEHMEVATKALDAAEDALARMARINEARSTKGEPSLQFGIALHLGDVTYGNIGADDRLEFTVIGPAMNEVARLEGLCKALNQKLLVSADFARAVPGTRLQSLGFQVLRGVSNPQEVFALAE